jgi:cyclic pyranopterin phosphate synthase
MLQPCQLVDHNNRIINYLRISITDRCNLRCIYCLEEEDFDYKPHEDILTYEEVLDLARLFVRRGIRKIRITGGEPLVRKDLPSFIHRLSRIRGLEEIALTTNGVLLEQYASALKDCDIRRLNVSMDTLRRERYEHITRRDCFEQVWRGIREAERLGFYPLKLNVVAIRGLNDDEVVDFARLALERPYHIRFIEYMPVGQSSRWSLEQFVSVGELQAMVEKFVPLEPVQSGPTEGPAQRFKLRDGAGEIGFIGAISHHFCATCNRLRLTADGKLRSCLFSDDEVDLKIPLRQGSADSYILSLMEGAVAQKPCGHNFEKLGPRKCGRRMVKIGG